MIRCVSDDLYQLAEHVEQAQGSEAISIYVLLNNGRPILIDCGSHLHRATILADLDDLIGDDVPEAIVLTHSELPHAGNIAAVAQRWPDIGVYVSNVMLPYIEVLPVLPLSQITQMTPGTAVTFGDRQLTFLDALLKDQPGSHWAYDSRTKALFTGDGFGYVQPAAANGRFSDEVGGVTVEQFAAYHRVAFRFLEWIRPAALGADIDRLFARLDVEIIAPVHGAAIRNDMAGHRARLVAALTAVQAGYPVRV